MELDNRETATVLAALHYWQEEVASKYPNTLHFAHFNDCTPLRFDEITALRERLNVAQPECDATLRTTTPPAQLPRHLAALIVNKKEADDELLNLLKLFYAVVVELVADVEAAGNDWPDLLHSYQHAKAAMDAAEKGL